MYVRRNLRKKIECGQVIFGVMAAAARALSSRIEGRDRPLFGLFMVPAHKTLLGAKSFLADLSHILIPRAILGGDLTCGSHPPGRAVLLSRFPEGRLALIFYKST